MGYSLEQDTFIVMSYYHNGTLIDGECTYSIVACKNGHLAKLPDPQIKESPLLKHIRGVINRFVQTGTVNKGKSTGRPQVSNEVMEELQERLEQDPQQSIARLSQQSGIPLSTCQKTTNKRLHLHPYKITTVHRPLPTDFPCRVEYCNWFQDILNYDKILIKNCCTIFLKPRDEEWSGV
jgi:hypothetical protein